MRALFWWAYIALLCCGVMALCGCEVTLPRYPANPEPPDLPDTQPAPLPDTADAYPATFINWHGQNFASAKVSAVLTGATFSDRWLTYNEPAPASWPIITVKVKVQAICCVFYGKESIEGGKFEWSKPNQTQRSTHNIKDGYNGLRMPKADEAVYACLVSVDGKHRTNIVKASRE